MTKGKIPILEFVQMLKDRGFDYNAEKGGIYSLKTGKRKGHLCTNGYYVIMLQKDKVEYYVCEHRVVWWWHHPETDESLVIDHLNCDRGDNRIENLEPVTSKENSQRTFERGRGNTCRGERSGRAKLLDREALAIRYLNQSGWARKDIASFIIGDKAEQPEEMAGKIIRGIRYGHLETPTDIWAVYPVIVAATARTDLPEEEQIKNALLGLAGELGEVIDLYKKHFYQGHELDEDELKEEIGDVMFYLTWLAVLCCGYDRAELMLRNADKLHNRYKNGFTVEESVNREEYRK